MKDKLIKEPNNKQGMMYLFFKISVPKYWIVPRTNKNMKWRIMISTTTLPIIISLLLDTSAIIMNITIGISEIINEEKKIRSM